MRGWAEFDTLIILGRSDTRVLLAPTVVSSSLGVVLNCLGACWLGFSGVVWAAVGFSLVYLLWMVYLAERACVAMVAEACRARSLAEEE